MRCRLYSQRVYLALNTKDGKNFAVKLPNPDTHMQTNAQIILKEAAVLRQLEHPNILKCYHFSQTGNQIDRDGSVQHK